MAFTTAFGVSGKVNLSVLTPYLSGSRTARQTVLYQEDDADKWYKGDQPTASEVTARIYTLYGNDKETGAKFFDSLKLLQQDKSSPLYNPYTFATNVALKAISSYGIDTSRGITDDWIQEYSYLKNYYRIGAGGTPLAPSAKSSNEENAAYYYYQILKDEETTRKAETEWAALQEEINYWVARTDRNYSDQQILDKIDWSKYSTLTSLDEDKKLGTPTSLNRSIDYSQDVLSGVVWAARNKSTGNVFVDSVQAALGSGRQYRLDADIAAKLDPTSDSFNPYSVGSTADEAMLYFGISSADDDWLTENRWILSSGDKTKIKNYQIIFDAHQFKKQAESELERLYADIDELLLTGPDPDRIIDNLLNDGAIRSTEKYEDAGYPTLRKLDSSLKSGELYNTSGAIDYKWSDVEQYIRDRCEEINAEEAEILRVKAENSVTEIKNEIINSAGDTIKYIGTDGEKDAFNFTYSANFNEYVNAIKAEIDNGKMTGGATYEYALGRANEYAAKNYMALKDTVSKYESAQTELAEAQAGLAEAEAAGENMLALDSDVTRMNLTVSENTAYLEKNKAAYEKALKGITAIEEAYTAANEIGDIVGGDISDGIVPTLNFVYEYGSEYVPTEWDAQTAFDAALEAGYSRAEVDAAAQEIIANNAESIKAIDYSLNVISENGVKIDGAYINNLNRRKAALERNAKAAQYHLLQNEQDFAEKSSEYAQKVKDAWKGYNPLVTFNNQPILGTGVKDGISYLSLSMVDITKSLGQNYAAAMTEAERNTYLFLADTHGEEAAQEYYTHLTDATYGAVIVRQSQKFGEIVQDFADQNAIGATVLSIVASPLQISGTIYAAGTAIAGDEINPYNPAFSMTTLVQGSRETVKANITESLGEGTFGAFAANLAYDIGTTSADSLTSAYLGGSAIGGTLLMSGEATASVIQYAKQRGATDEQALAVGGIAFAAEFATEILPQTLLRKAFRAGAAGNVSAFKKIIAADITAGTLGEMLAELIEGTSDTLIMGAMSQREQRVNTYIDQGMTAEEAEKQADWDFFYDIGYAGLVGLLAEGTGQVSAYTAGKISNVFKPAQKNTPPADNAPPSGNAPVEPGNGPNLNDNVSGTNIQAKVETPTDVLRSLAEKSLRNIAALDDALMTNDLAGQTAAVAASLEESDADTDAAVAASKLLAKKHGARGTVKAMRDIKKANVPGAELAVMAAALSKDTNAKAALNTVFTGPATKENVAALVEASKGIVDKGAMQAAITDSMVSERVKELVGDGKLQGLQSLQASLSQARQNLSEAQTKLEQAKRDYDISGENAQIANAQFIQNPSAPELRNRVSQAVNKLEGKAIVVQQMQESVEKYTTQLSAADKMLKSARKTAMKDIRQQAMDEVKQLQTEREAGIKAAILRNAVTPETAQDQPLFTKGTQRGTETTGQTKATTTAPVVSPVETAVQLADALGIGKTISTRKMNTFPAKVKGYYLERARHMAIRSGNSSDFTITMHELGHAVSERLGMVGTNEMISNLPGMFADQYSADALPKESFAEFFWRYIEDEGTARAFAGDSFYNNFEREMKRAGIYDAVTEARDRMQTYNSVSTIEQTKARLVDASKKTYSKNGILNTLHNRLRNYEAGTFNWAAFARDIDKQITKQGGKAAVETLLQMRNFSARQAGNMLKNPLFDPTGRQQIAGSFADTMDPYITPQTFEDYNAYLILLHSLDMDALNIEVLNTPRADRQAAVKEMEQSNPEFKEARAALSEWWDALMTAYMVEPGLLSAETYAKWKKQNPNYVPQRRLVGSAPSVGTSADSGNIFKKRLGSDLDIIMPIDSLMNYLPRIVAEMRKVRAKQEFHYRYKDTPGLGLWARPVTPDAVESSVSTEGIRELLEKTLLDKADPDALATVFDKLGERWSEWRMTKDTSLPNVMDVPLPNGETVLYQVDDPNIFDMFMGNDENIPAVPTGFRYQGKFTKLLQRMYTSASPAFLVSNPLNDVIEATVNGTFAATTFDAVAKAVPQMIDIYRKKGRYQAFMALGGGGWHRVDVGTERGISDYRNQVMKKYWASSAKEVGKAVVRTTGNILTLEPVQEANENMFRYLEFLSKNYDRSTEIGNYEAFIAGQNVSTNFASHGRSKTVAILRTMIPFLNPALQGIYRDARALTGPRRGKVIAKLVFNNLLMRGLALAARKAFFDDDDKEYETLPAEIKMTNIIFPNIVGEDAPDWMTAADRRLIRIPFGRSPLMLLISGTATALIDYADGKDDIGTQAIMMAAAFADDLTFGASSIFTTDGELKERFNSLLQGTVAASLWGVSTNQTYFGDSIENVGMSYLPQSLRYNDYTSTLAKSIGGALNVSPVQIDYLIQQTFGVGGQVILDSVDKGGNVLQSVVDTIAKRLTIDPSYSNDITDMYYADRQTLNQLVQGGTRMNADGGLLNPGLTDTERKNAFEEAKELISKGGTFGQIDEAITAAWDNINKVMADESLTAKEKRLLTRDIRDQIVQLEFSAHQTMGEFNAKYVSGNSSLIELMQPQELVPYTALEKLSEVFTSAYTDGNPVMTNLVELWQETGLDKYLPTPRSSDVSKEVPDDKLEDWDAAYWDGFSGYIGAHIAEWDGLTEEAKAKIISSAKSSGTNAAKNWYEKLKSLQD